MDNLEITKEQLEEKKGKLYIGENENWEFKDYQIIKDDGPCVKKCILRFTCSTGFFDEDKPDISEKVMNIELDLTRPANSEEQGVLDWLKES